MSTFANRLIYRRKDCLGLRNRHDFFLSSKENLAADRISEELLQQFESGVKQPTWNQAFALSKPLGCSAQWLFTGKGPMNL